jgi:serine protease inhibitor
MPTTTPLLLVLSLAAPQQQAPELAARTTNELGLALYKALDQERAGKNLFFSPLSIAISMAMLAEGAREETAAELRQALRLDANTPLADLHAGYQSLLSRYRNGGASEPELRKRFAQLQQDCTSSPTPQLADALEKLRQGSELYDLRVANSVWVDRALPLAPAFTAILDRRYGTGTANQLDLRNAPEAARQRINDWVATRTDRVIGELLPPGAIDATTAIVLGNALYFRGDWTIPFGTDETREGDFLVADGERVRTRFMHDSDRTAVSYAAFTADGTFFETPKLVPSDAAKRPPVYPGDDGFTMIELPYKSGEVAMVVIAPRKPEGLPRLEARLDAASLATWLRHLERREVDTTMWRFERSCEFELARVLQALGVRRVFTPNAQLAGISERRPLFLSRVDHQAWLMVNEVGTVAAAATVTTTMIGAYSGNWVPFRPVFRADRPFVFLIRDVNSGAILFLGRVTDPRV